MKHLRTKPYVVWISKDRVTHRYGRFNTVEEAEAEAKLRRVEFFGEFAHD